MLWIGGQITSLNIMKALFIPSIICLVIPLAIVSYTLRGQPIIAPKAKETVADKYTTTPFERNFMFFGGIGILCAVPLFKTLTHLPPFMGILFGLGLLWLAGEIIHRDKTDDNCKHLTLVAALQRIDISSLVFFIGILMSVATLEHTHVLAALATWLENTIGNQSIIVVALGLLSAVVDNVPLVAASIGMYPLTTYPTDSFLWEFLAYAVGTGGSILIIGSAAGVAAMSLEKIEFFWYMRKISFLALSGYAGGCLYYALTHL
jgi:Na+/H+ antiporter NhaD/arsenite permease-like protein